MDLRRIGLVMLVAVSVGACTPAPVPYPDQIAAWHAEKDRFMRESPESPVPAAERSVTLATNRYRGGVTSYLEVIAAQNAALTNQRTAVSILSRRLAASVLLIKALGGGWTAAALPVIGSETRR